MKKERLLLAIIMLCLVPGFLFGQYKEFQYGDSLRKYLVYEPSEEPGPLGYPLVIGLHGTGSNGAQFVATASLLQKAKQEGFVYACPDALMNQNFTYFNVGGAFEEMTNGTDDIGFISAMLDSMIANYDIDTTRIFVTGFSNGSAMSYRVAAELSNRIAAVGAVSGQMVYEHCNPVVPIPIMHFHGLSDPLLPFEGGEAAPPVMETMETWCGVNNCTEIPDTILNEDGILGLKWASLSTDADVILYTIEDQEHEWPRSGTLGISATDEIWDFFVAHPKPSQKYLESKEMVFDDEDRTYIVFDPSPGTGPKPLVIGLHCHTGTAAGLLTYTGLIQKAYDENFLGVFPNGLKHIIGTAWNVGSSFEELTMGTNDVGFINALIDTIIRDYQVDTTRIYATGHSNGSMMSYRLAAELSHRIAAIGCVSAPMVNESCDPEYPVPIIHFHGLSDTTCPYDGMAGDYVTVPPVDSCIALWIEANGCDEEPEVIYNENGVTGKRWNSEGGAGDIILYTIDDCMHDWPVEEKYGISATDAIWDFFTLYTREVITGVEEGKQMFAVQELCVYQNYPNPFTDRTKIRYQLNIGANTSIRIYNIIGEEIAQLMNKYQVPGDYEINWAPGDLPPGIYFYKVMAGESIVINDMILCK